MIEPESEEIASSPDLATAVVGSPDDPARRTQAWLKESVEDTYSDSENETEESLLSEEFDELKSRSRKKKIKRDTKYTPTLKDLQLVGDILFTERPTVGYSANEQKELIALGDVTNLASEGRVSVFEKGLHFEKKGKPGLALQCYLACIQGLDGEVGNFPQLPQCLRHIARLYFAEEEYEKAVHFVQAEKLYYETAILSTRDKKAEDESDTSTDEPLDLKSMMIARAQEFEQLADMCLHSKNVGLALDYIGKAAKINEAVYGKNDHRSRQSYEKFSYIYAEAGKLQYNDALKRFQRKQSQSTMKVLERQEPPAEEELFTPEQSLTQKVFSLALLFIFLVIIIIEVTLVILSFSKGYLYIPSGTEVLNFFRYFWLKIIGPQEL